MTRQIMGSCLTLKTIDKLTHTQNHFKSEFLFLKIQDVISTQECPAAATSAEWQMAKFIFHFKYVKRHLGKKVNQRDFRTKKVQNDENLCKYR